MKIGILTFHNTLNYGAALQTYATQAALNKLGVENEIIDYTNEFRRQLYSEKKLILRSLKNRQILGAVRTLAGTPFIKRRKKNFDKFYRERVAVSKEKYFSADQLKATPPKYDYYMVGSDQVWNYDHNGQDMSYLLDFVSDKAKTISYASSFGLDSISENVKDDYIRLLGSIQYLSVREKMGSKIIQSLTGRIPSVVLDPVFLLNKNQWQNITDDNIGKSEPYILLYTTKAKHYRDFLRITKYDSYGIRVVHIGTSMRLCDMFKRNTNISFASSPEKFLGLIKNAKLVLTSSFHGTAFSILFKKQFVSFRGNNLGKDARIVELLGDLGISDRLFHDKMTADQVNKQICYESVQEKLERLREESMRFLHQALTSGIEDKRE